MKTVRLPIGPDEVFVFAHGNGDGTVTLYDEGDTRPAQPAIEPTIVLTPRQFRQALTRAGIRAAVDAAIAAGTDQDVKDWYAFADQFELGHPAVQATAAALGFSQAELKAVFELGASL